jgi:hypothetical protein
MDDAFPGGIYTTNTDPWGWVTQPKPEDVKTWYRPGDWNSVVVTVKGARVTVAYNGIRTAETSDARLPSKGRFGFQVHRLTECEVWLADAAVEVPAPVTLVLPKGRAGARAEADGRDALGRYLTIRRSERPPLMPLSR